MEESHEKWEEKNWYKEILHNVEIEKVYEENVMWVICKLFWKKVTMRYSIRSSRWNAHANTVLNRDSKDRHEHGNKTSKLKQTSLMSFVSNSKAV